MADDFRPSEDDRIYDDRADPPAPRYSRRGRRLMTALIAIAAVLGFGVVVIYAYNKGRQAGESSSPPIIQATKEPTKTRPESPGGMKVPHQDKEIFSRLDANEQPDKVERLLPPPEKPVAPPEPAAADSVTKAEPAAGGDKTASESTAASGETAAKTPAETSTPPAPSKTAAVEPPKAPEPAPKPQAKAAPKPTAAKAAPARKTASAGGWKIQLASLRSEAAAKKSWSILQKKHRSLLGSLSLHLGKVTLSGGRGTFYRVQAGPLASHDAASSLCSRLKAQKQSCLVVRP